jgi:hypothetical protein
MSIDEFGVPAGAAALIAASLFSTSIGSTVWKPSRPRKNIRITSPLIIVAATAISIEFKRPSTIRPMAKENKRVLAFIIKNA